MSARGSAGGVREGGRRGGGARGVRVTVVGYEDVGREEGFALYILAYTPNPHSRTATLKKAMTILKDPSELFGSRGEKRRISFSVYFLTYDYLPSLRWQHRARRDANWRQCHSPFVLAHFRTSFREALVAGSMLACLSFILASTAFGWQFFGCHRLIAFPPSHVCPNGFATQMFSISRSIFRPG